ncbi:MAG: hypothetical protein A2Y12_05750 [Planctomycetes bacterium GWF2_42_9]|nr:MAG: hypothetical protein A2Y12_05750 [Planctomycetes bacterium GWF2_42_9]HAL45044.1 hypothetical protein [Phycisphaerales bacterium]
MKKYVFIICLCCLFLSVYAKAEDKTILPGTQDLNAIKKIVIFVEQKREFEVFHWRAKTAYGTASLLGGFEGDAIAHKIDKDKDTKEAAPMLDSIKDISCSEMFIESLKPIKESKQFEKVDIKTGEFEKSSLKEYDAAIAFTIKKWGIRLVDRENEKLAGFTELEVKMLKANEKKPIWDQREVVVSGQKQTIEGFTADGKMLNEEVRTAIKKAGAQMSNVLLYPSAKAEPKKEAKKEKGKKEKVKAESLPINNDITFKTGPLGTLKPLKIDVQPFTDNRQTKDKIGELRNGFGGKAGAVNANRPATDIVTDAIGSTFTANGHTLNNTEKDIIITGSVDTYWFESQLRMSSWELMGTIDINLVVQDNKGKVLFTKKYSGHHDRVLGLFWPKTIIEIMDAAMANLTDQIPYDAQLIDAIKTYQK